MPTPDTEPPAAAAVERRRTNADPRSDPMPRPAYSLLLLLLLASGGATLSSTPLAASPAAAADASAAVDTVEPGTGAPFPAPAASTLEPRTRLAPVRVDRSGRNRWVGLVDLGETIPFRLHRADARAPSGSPPSALWGEVAGAAFSRFDLEGHGNEFIEVHYRVALRLRARWRGLEARVAAYHVSSHLGDEFLERTGRDPISTSREGLELLAAVRPVPDLRIYGGPGLVLRSTAGLDPGTARLGAEWRPADRRWGPFRPYAAGELLLRDELGWEPTASTEAGLAFGGRYRLALMVGAGPSRAEQFFRQDETLWGLSFSADF